MKEGKAYRKLYAGDWKCDKRDGFGILYYRDGGKYEGGWKEGRRHGRGVMQYSNGDVYEGDWAQDGRCGIGILRVANGDRFEGHWMDDTKEGPGVYFFVSTGKMYEGEWAGGVAKCGQIRDMDPELLRQPQLVPEPFLIPKLEVDRPDHVLNEAVAHVRQKRVRRHLQEEKEEKREGDVDQDMAFTDAELTCIYESFQRVDQHKTGTILCGQVPELLDLLGLSMDPQWLMQFLAGIDAGPDTPVTFSEVVDIVAIGLGEE